MSAHSLFSRTVERYSWLCVLVLSAVVMLTGLGGPRLWDRDEPRNAGCAAEMLERGDWVTPVFNGELRSHKPVLLYWLMMPGYAAWGVNEFTARLPSALLAVGTALLTWFIGTRLFNRQVGLLSAIVLCTTMMFVVAGRAATPDSVLIFCTTAATAMFVAWAFPRTGPSPLEEKTRALPWTVAAGVYGCMGWAMLAKGPVGLVVPTAVIGMYLLLKRLPLADVGTDLPRWKRRGWVLLASFHPLHFLRTCWWMRPVTALAVSLAIALPWYVWVGLRTDGAWLEGFFLEHNLGRAMRPMESHGGGPWYYPIALLAGFFPWSIFAAPTLVGIWRQGPGEQTIHDRAPEDLRRSQDGVLFAVCWVGVYVGLFTIARTKLPSYVTPCYPALALLTAWQLQQWATRRGFHADATRWLHVGFAALAVVGLGVLIGVPIAATQLLPGEQWLAIGGLIPVATAGAAWWAVRRGRRRAMIYAMSCGAAMLVVTTFGLLAPHVSKHQQFSQLLAAMEANSDNPRIATYECMEPSWVFYAHRRIGRVWMAKERTAAELAAEAQRPRWSPDPSRTDMDAFMSDPDAFVITTGWQYNRIKRELPSQVEIVARAPLFLKKTDLLVLRRKASASPLARRDSPQR